ncbi:tetratricopeptide repeat-containing protein kinase family protein [Streptomyces sp. NBC_01264]|uniref:tetratricopeptide repeat-containing protein kinase family protein n=1 Tax=Streptomyces sp. NBC_01264 TaxID=2903804 RepID=UPI00224E65DA|nr:tetratricopeptide repeat-containing protein kinase family protein [Streptomyces sp. NBC_01264]MCX4776097.1 tetratricopeptide repeat-containing serine/threonine-protein kinase [Streptomyces sp. NBC_01264]
MTKVLADSGAELSHEELLDALWLAGRLPRDAVPLARAAGVSAIPAERHGTPHDGTSSAASGNAEPVGTATEPAGAEHTKSEPTLPILAHARRRAREDAEVHATVASSPAISVRAPDTGLILDGQLRLGKSLRPLRQRFPDRRRHELDVTRTVAAIADTGVPETVTRPTRTRWLSLALVVDDGVSMVLWQRLAAEVRALMERAGAFRDVRVYGLDTRGATPSLRTSPYRQRGRLQSPKTLCDPTGSTLVLIVSDGIGDAWWDGGMREVTDRWARCGPTAIVQALPPRLWPSTGIRARRWQVTTRGRGGPTRAWHVTDPDLPPGLVSFDSVPVPVLEPTPAAIADWALLIASPGGTALLPLWDTALPGFVRPAADTRRNDAAEALLRFRDAASPEAYRLAAHVAAVAPVTPPVMRMVQAALGHPTDRGHLTEVFLGGLMHEVDADERDRLPHHRRFDFSSDARRILLNAVSPKELLRTTEAVTRGIEDTVGRAPAFPAWVGHPDGAAMVEDTGRSFGWLREQLLTRLGIPSAGVGPVAPVPGRPQTPEGVTEDPATAGTAWSDGPGVPGKQDTRSNDDETGELLPAGWVELLPGDPVQLGRFRLQARSARGWPHMAMYLARDEDGTVVTVRAPSLLHADDPRAALDLVSTEAECLLRMQGTYAPALVEVQTHSAEELPWIAATCVHRRADDASSAPAPNLRSVLDEHRGSVPEQLFLRIGFGLSEALARAHGLGLVHGSLAPRSVLVTDEAVWLVGWATATVDGGDSTYREVLPVSDTYLVAADGGLFLTSQSDMYAAGALLLAFLAGRWRDPRYGEEHRGPLSASGIDPVLHRMLRRCLDREPARRPSAAALAEAFAAASVVPATANAAEGFITGMAKDILRIRRLARRDLSTHGPVLSDHLMTFSNHLALVGRNDESVAAVQEAVQVYRELAARDSRAYSAGLGTALSNLSVRLGEDGRTEESLNAVSEAEALYRQLSLRDFGVFGPGHAMVLNNLSNRLAAVGKGREALRAINEAVEIDRRLVDSGRQAHGGDLARGLTSLGRRLGGLGRYDEALSVASEAVQIYRMLPENHARRAQDYAVSLNNLAVLLGELGRHGEALSVVDESVVAQRRYRRDLASAASEIREQSERIKTWLTDLIAVVPQR